MKVYKIKMEDKAALLNRLKKYNVPAGTNEIQDNELEGYFTLTIEDPTEVEIVNSLLKKSPRIDILREFLRKEIRKMLKEITVNKPKREIKAEDITWDYDIYVDDVDEDEFGDNYGSGTISGNRGKKKYQAKFSVPYNRYDDYDMNNIHIYDIEEVDIEEND
jgi:hypothetical protein